MNTLKSLMVVAVLGVIGYGVYVVLNNNPPPPTPDWVKAETSPSIGPPNLQMGTPVAPGEALPPIGAASNYRPPAPGAGGDAPSYAAAGSAPTSYGAVSTAPANNDLTGVSGGAPATPSPASYGGVQNSSAPPVGGVDGNYGSPSGATQSRTAAIAASYRQPTDAPSAYGATTTPAASGAAASPSRSEARPRYADAVGESGRSPVATRDATAGRGQSSFDATMAAAQGQLDGGQLDMALLTLSNLYDDARLGQRETERLNAVLDQVAGTVIYSRKYPLEPPHRVGPGEQKLIDVAKKYDVPAGLLAKINGISEQTDLTPGQELKIIHGPFMAIVNMQKRTLAVMVGGRYAGRFPISVSPELSQLEGQFVVARKTREDIRYDGQRYIELGPPAPGSSQQAPLAIVGLSDPATIDRSHGLIGMTPKNADDLWDILSQGSKVVIHR